MIEGACHCGGVRYTVDTAPTTALDCNCSHCRLYGSLWAYYPQRDVKFATPPDTFVYQWGDRMLDMHHCRTCGCFSHFTITGDDDAEKIGLNIRLMRGLTPETVSIVQKNNGNDHVFWTKSDRPVLPSHDQPAQS